MALIDYPALEQLALRALLRAGVPADHASTQANVLLEADLRGIHSHGLMRLERIVARIGNRVADPEAIGLHHWQGSAFLAVDGQCGLGPVVARAALDALTSRVEDTGIALAAIRNSNHVGMLGWYVEQLAEQGYSTIALTISEALVHPWGARQAMIGTNPIAIGVPSGSGVFVMDTATSVTSMGEIHDHAHRRARLPEGWALDADGEPTTDPEAAKTGAIAPFGEVKGYVLGLALELLVGSLAGAALGREVRGTLDDTEICNKGDIFIVIKGPDRALEGYLAAIRAMEPAPGFERVLIPGERARACRELRLREGVPIPDTVWQTLQRLAG